MTVTAVGVLPPFMTAAMAVQIRRDLDMDVSMLGLLLGLYFAVSAVFSPAMGRVVERRGWEDGIRYSALGVGIVLLAMAAVARNAGTIAGIFAVGGVAAAISHPAANLALARSVPVFRHGLLFGLKHVAVPVAAILGGLAVPGFALTIGWRWAYVAAAGIALLTALGAARLRSDATAEGRVSGEGRTSTAVSALVLLAAASAFGIAAADGLAAFIVAYAVDVGFGEASAGILLAAGSVSGLITRLAAGWLVDRRQHTGVFVMSGLVASGALGLATMAAGGEPWLIAGAVLGFAGGWGWSGLMTFVVVWANPSAPATATGITHTGTYVGAALGPPLLGTVADSVSFAAAWWLAAASLGVAAALLLASGLARSEHWAVRPQRGPG